MKKSIFFRFALILTVTTLIFIPTGCSKSGSKTKAVITKNKSPKNIQKKNPQKTDNIVAQDPQTEQAPAEPETKVVAVTNQPNKPQAQNNIQPQPQPKPQPKPQQNPVPEPGPKSRPAPQTLGTMSISSEKKSAEASEPVLLQVEAKDTNGNPMSVEPQWEVTSAKNFPDDFPLIPGITDSPEIMQSASAGTVIDNNFTGTLAQEYTIKAHVGRITSNEIKITVTKSQLAFITLEGTIDSDGMGSADMVSNLRDIGYNSLSKYNLQFKLAPGFVSKDGVWDFPVDAPFEMTASYIFNGVNHDYKGTGNAISLLDAITAGLPSVPGETVPPELQLPPGIKIGLINLNNENDQIIPELKSTQISGVYIIWLDSLGKNHIYLVLTSEELITNILNKYGNVTGGLGLLPNGIY